MERADRMVHFNQYKRRVTGFTNRGTAPNVLRKIYDWYQSDGGRTLFLEDFRYETGIRINPGSDAASRIGAAIPKNWGDYVAT